MVGRQEDIDQLLEAFVVRPRRADRDRRGVISRRTHQILRISEPLVRFAVPLQEARRAFRDDRIIERISESWRLSSVRRSSTRIFLY